MDCPHPIKSVLPRFYPTWSAQTRPSKRIQRSEGLGSRLLVTGDKFMVLAAGSQAEHCNECFLVGCTSLEFDWDLNN